MTAIDWEKWYRFAQDNVYRWMGISEDLQGKCTRLRLRIKVLEREANEGLKAKKELTKLQQYMGNLPEKKLAYMHCWHGNHCYWEKQAKSSRERSEQSDYWWGLWNQRECELHLANLRIRELEQQLAAKEDK